MKTKNKNTESFVRVDAIALLLIAETGVRTTVWESTALPLLWWDFPDGYSVFHTSLDIHTGECPVAIFYKGDYMNAGLKTAQRVMVRAGYACQLCPKSASNPEAKPKLIVETKVS